MPTAKTMRRLHFQPAWNAHKPGRRRPNAPTIPEQAWANYRLLIEELYVHNDLTLHDLMKHMVDVHNFDASKRQYTKKLKDWGFQKYKTSPEKKNVDSANARLPNKRTSSTRSASTSRQWSPQQHWIDLPSTHDVSLGQSTGASEQHLEKFHLPEYREDSLDPNALTYPWRLWSPSISAPEGSSINVKTSQQPNQIVSYAQIRTPQAPGGQYGQSNLSQADQSMPPTTTTDPAPFLRETSFELAFDLSDDDYLVPKSDVELSFLKANPTSIHTAPAHLRSYRGRSQAEIKGHHRGLPDTISNISQEISQSTPWGTHSLAHYGDWMANLNLDKMR